MRLLGIVAAAVAIGLAGCAEQLARANAAYEDAFVPLEEAGRFDYWRQKASIPDLLKDGRPRSLVEIGRRYEKGLGVRQDRDCAGFWYNRAFLAGYDEVDNTYVNGHVVNLGTKRRSGLPQARVAFRRLQKGGPVAELDAKTARIRCLPAGL